MFIHNCRQNTDFPELFKEFTGGNQEKTDSASFYFSPPASVWQFQVQPVYLAG